MKKINAVEMVRNIRDKQNKDTAGMSPKEIIEYFQQKARQFTKKLGAKELSER